MIVKDFVKKGKSAGKSGLQFQASGQRFLALGICRARSGNVKYLEGKRLHRAARDAFIFGTKFENTGSDNIS